MENNWWGADRGYESLDEGSTDEEKLNIVFNILLKEVDRITNLDYKKLFVAGREAMFNALVINTGFADAVENKNNLHNPSFKLNKEGLLMLNQYHSFLAYHTNITTQNALDRGKQYEIGEITFKKLKYDLANAERAYKSYKITRILAWVGAITGIIALLLKAAESFSKLHR